MTTFYDGRYLVSTVTTEGIHAATCRRKKQALAHAERIAEDCLTADTLAAVEVWKLNSVGEKDLLVARVSNL